MGNTYRVSGRRAVLDHEPGDTFDAELTAEQEELLLRAGRLEIVPRAYRVVGSSRVFGTDPDGVFEAALTVTQEAQLTAGGHIARVDAQPEKKRPARGGKPEAKPQPAEGAAGE